MNCRTLTSLDVFVEFFNLAKTLCVKRHATLVNIILQLLPESVGTAVAQWLRYCATIRRVAGSIPPGVSGFFIDIKSF